MTLDHDWLLQNLERVRIGLVEDGTAIGSAHVRSSESLERQSIEKSRDRAFDRWRKQRGQDSAEHCRRSDQGAARFISMRSAPGTNGIAPDPVLDPRTGNPDRHTGNVLYQNQPVHFNEAA